MKNYLVLIVMSLMNLKVISVIYYSQLFFILKYFLLLATFLFLCISLFAFVLHLRNDLGFIRYKKKFINLLSDKLKREDVRDFEKSVDAINKEDFEVELISLMNKFQNAFYIRADWKADDEFFYQAQSVLNELNISNNLAFNEDNSHEIEELILRFDSILKQSNYCYVEWDQDSDEYVGLVYDISTAEKLIFFARKLGIKLGYIYHKPS